MGENLSRQLKYSILGVLAIWLIAELVVGAGVMSKTYSDARKLTRYPTEERQVHKLSGITPIAGELKNIAKDLPSDAKVFMHNGLVEDYYLANYFLYPRKVLVDEPEVAANGVRGQKIGKDLSKQRLEELGVTHIIAISPSRDAVRVIAMEGIKRD